MLLLMLLLLLLLLLRRRCVSRAGFSGLQLLRLLTVVSLNGHALRLQGRRWGNVSLRRGWPKRV